MSPKNNQFIWVLLLIAVPFAWVWYVYPTLPNTIPTHFNYKGEADAWNEKSAIFLSPAIMAIVSLIVYGVMRNIKKIDPKKYNVKDDGIYSTFALITVGFLSTISLIIIYASSNNTITISKLLLPTIGLFFSALGWMLPKLGQNYFAGIRLPWTLDNVDNWNATHQLAGKVWSLGGVFIAVGTFIVPDQIAFIVFIAGIILMVAIPVIFSYRMFKKGNKIY